MTTEPEQQKTKTVVIYHRADFDGIFCREIARKFIPDAVLIGWDYGDPTPAKELLDGKETLYMLDISIPDLMDHPNLIWIDHHKSAIEKFGGTGLHDKPMGYRIDGVAACRLAWQWFTMHVDGNTSEGLPSHHRLTCLADKQDFIDRTVSEPFAVRLAGEYDIWDKRDERSELFQDGLRSQELTGEDWTELLDEKATIGFASKVQKLLHQGQGITYAKRQENAGIIKSYGFDLDFEGLHFLACNHARFNSLLFTEGVKPEHDALIGFNWTGTAWRISLYHAPGKEHHDLADIAVRYGGGGHKGACGFVTKHLPFLLKL